MSSKASIIVSRFKSWDSSYCTRCYVRIRRPHSGNRTKPSKNHHSYRFQIKISISYNQGALHRGKPVFLNAKIHEGILFQFQHLAFTYISLFSFDISWFFRTNLSIIWKNIDDSFYFCFCRFYANKIIMLYHVLPTPYFFHHLINQNLCILLSTINEGTCAMTYRPLPQGRYRPSYSRR